MVENVEKLANNTVSVSLTENYRKTLTKGQWGQGILFYSIHLYKVYVPSKFIEKILTIVSKNRHYLSAEAMQRFYFPFETFKDLNPLHYVAVLGTRKGKLPPHEKTIGFLFHYSRERALLIGVWPLENRFHFQNLSEKDIKETTIRTLKLLTKPKLWESVLALISAPNAMTNKDLKQLVQESQEKMNKSFAIASDILKDTQELIDKFKKEE